MDVSIIACITIVESSLEGVAFIIGNVSFIMGSGQVCMKAAMRTKHGDITRVLDNSSVGGGDWDFRVSVYCMGLAHGCSTVQ